MTRGIFRSQYRENTLLGASAISNHQGYRIDYTSSCGVVGIITRLGSFSRGKFKEEELYGDGVTIRKELERSTGEDFQSLEKVVH